MEISKAARTQRGNRKAAIFPGLAGTLVLAACGGGGYGGSSTPPPPSPTVTLAAQPSTVVLGQSVTLQWTAPAGADCTASGSWTGSQAANGSTTVVPTAVGTSTYTLKCTVTSTGYGGGSSSGQASAQVTVTAASGFTATKLVSDTNAGGGLITDASLVNPWGIAFGPGFSWVANNHTDTSTLYDGNGKAQPAGAALVVAFANGAGGVSFDPTGVVYNAGSGFVVSSGAVSGAAKFLFAGEGGMIAGWSQAVDATHAITVYADAGGAVYKGLAIASNGTSTFIYATDFHNGKVDVFDSSFALQPASAFPFTDATLPAGYAPFGIQALKTGAGGAMQVYVSYAKQALPDKHDETDGAGLGLVDVYDANGQFVSHLVATGGKLDAPWGMALAPSTFGTLGSTLLVGNFGDGTINAFDGPVRQSFGVELVGRDQLVNAVALNSSIFNMARIMGPAVAGVAIAAVGISTAFLVNAVSFLGVLGAYAIMRPAEFHTVPPKKAAYSPVQDRARRYCLRVIGTRSWNTESGVGMGSPVVEHWKWASLT